MTANILIAGGTGLIGRRLTEILIHKGYTVSHLSRSKREGKIKTYQWNVKEKVLEEEAIKSADFIINFAGTSVFENKWTKTLKKEILQSRTESAALIAHKLKTVPHHVKGFISASAIGYYGADTGEKIVDENTPPGEDFLAHVVTSWESASDKIKALNIRTVKFRFGIVLSTEGGALEKLLQPIKMGAGAVLGSGRQYVSWIHIDDLCHIIIKAIEDENIHGVYNAVAPHPVSNEELTKTAAHKMGKSIMLPNVPVFALKLMLGGEKAMLVAGGNNVSASKILSAGYQFQFPDLKSALDNLLKNQNNMTN